MRAAARRFYGYLKKDSMLLYKRKKYLALFILLPLVIAALFLFALNPSGYNISVGICDFDDTDISRGAFSDLSGFDPILMDDENCVENLIDDIKGGRLDLGIEIEKGFANNIENLKQSRLNVYYDNTDIAFTNLIAWKVDQSLNPFKRQILDSLNSEVGSSASSARGGIDLVFDFVDLPSGIKDRADGVDSDLKKVEELDTEFLINPIWTDKRPIYEAGLKKDAGIVYIFPILAIFIILMLASTSIIYDKNTNFLTRVKASASPVSYLLAKTLFFTFLVLIQFVVILLLFMAFGGRYAMPIGSLIHLILFVGIINSLVGFVIGLIANNEGIAVLFSLMISFPLMLVSGIFFPTQALPGFVRWISSVLPLSYQISASKAVLLFGQGFSNVWIWFAVVLFGIVWWLIRRS